MRVPDISVSRVHAEITYKHKKWYLEDLESKFGTLVQVTKPIKISPDLRNSVKIQISRTIFTMRISKIEEDKIPKMRIFCCCCFLKKPAKQTKN
jgi:pSer/pThr/pTyr-binding forkhead associated (FHA) protein